MTEAIRTARQHLLVSVCIIVGIVLGVFAQKYEEHARWGSCTSMQVTSKDTRTAVQIRRDMER